MHPQVLSGQSTERCYPHDTGLRSLPWALIQFVERGPYCIDCDGKTYTLQNEEAWIIPPQVANRVYAPQKNRVVQTAWIHFRCQLEDGTDLFDHYQFSRILRDDAAQRLGAALHELLYWRERAAESIPNAVRFEKRLYALLEQLFTCGELIPHIQQNQAHLVQAVQFEINQNLQHAWDRTSMAALAHLSVSRFHDVFKDTCGMAPAHWLRQQRIDHAKDLLAHSALRVVSIAKQCGFDDPYHFSRVFKHMTGQSPSAWREQLRH